MFVEGVVSRRTQCGESLTKIEGREDQPILGGRRNVVCRKSEAGEIERLTKGLAGVGRAACADANFAQQSRSKRDVVVERAAPLGVRPWAIVAGRRGVSIVTERCEVLAPVREAKERVPFG